MKIPSLSLQRWHRPVVAACLLAATAACTTVGPDYRVPQEAAISQQAAAAPFIGANNPTFDSNPLPPQWWRLYHDATLDRLVDQALVANADLRIAAANLARAHAVMQEAEVAGHPAVGLSAAPGYGRPSAAAKGLREPLPDDWSVDAGVSVSYQVDLFGRIARAVEAAGADTQAAQAAYDLARVTVVAETARAYADACSAGRQIAVAQGSVKLQQSFVQLTERRVHAGRSTALDNSRARGQLEQLHAAVPPLEAQRRTALYRLSMLTGGTPGVLPPGVEQCSSAPRLQATIPVGDGAALLRRRPDIRQAERGLAAATARIGVATADLYPSISLGLSAGSTGSLAQFGTAPSFRWSLGPLISWTLPSMGAARSRIAQAEAGTAGALAHFDAIVLNALRETESALTVYARELDRNASLKAARDQSAIAAQQAGTLYSKGRADFLTTLDADRTLAAAESALAASDAQLAADQVALFLALGGGWEQPVRTS
jgi:NodT family efflux transporter outer membrane factor (OMF) lipoprotein